MRNSNAIFLATTAALTLSACQASLQSLPDLDRTTSATMALKGATYALPMVTFDIAVTRTLSDCDTQVQLPPSIAGGTDGEKLAIWQGGPGISIAGEAKPMSVPGESYRYDPAKLVAWSKTTNFNMTYQKGSNLLKGINSSIDDQTGPILADVVATGLAVASVALGPGWLAGAAGAASAAASQLGKTELKFNYSEAVKTKLPSSIMKYVDLERAEKIEKLKELIKKASTEQSQVICTDKARKLQADLKAAGAEKEKLAAQAKTETRKIDALLAVARVRPLTIKQRDDLATLVEKLDGILRAVDDQQTIIDDSTKALSITSNTRWPKTYDESGLTSVAVIDPKKENKFNGLLTTAGAEHRLLNPRLLADELAKGENAELRKEFIDWVADYVWPDARVRFTAEDERKIEKGCRSNAKNDVGVTVPNCLATLLPVAVQITKTVGYEPPECIQQSAGTADTTTQPTDTTAKPVVATGTMAQSASKTVCLAKSEKGAIAARDSKADKGLFYRTPVPGQLKLCRATSDISPGCILETNSIIQKDIVVPQLGQLRFLPLNNDIFENTGLIANFDENGAMTDVSFVTSKAAGASMAASAAKIAASVKTAKDEDKKQVQADEDRAEAKAEAKAKADTAAAAKKKADEEEANTAERTANENLAKDAQAEADLAKARLAAIVATRCLDVASTSDAVPGKCPAD